MKTLIEYIEETFIPSLVDIINEDKLFTYYTYNPKNKRFNFNIIGTLHSSERDMERLIQSHEVVDLIKDCWGRIKQGILDGKVLIGLPDSNKSGASICLHSNEKLRGGYLSVALFIKQYRTKQDVYDIYVKTTWKGNTIDSYKERDKEGHTMYHPEHGLLDMWCNDAIRRDGKEDTMQVLCSGIKRKKTKKKEYKPTPLPLFKIQGKIDLDKIPKK